MVWSFLGGVASGLLGGLFGHTSAKQQQSYNTANMASQNKYNTQEMKYDNDLNKDLAKYNQELTFQNLQYSPTALRQGMEYAGFNPILAYSNGNFTNATSPGSSPALGSSLPNSPNPDYGSAVTNAVQFALHARQQRNQDNLTNAQVANINADSELKDMMASSESVKQMLGLTQQELMWSQTEINRLDQEYKRKQISWYDYQQQREDIKTDIEHYKAQAARVSALAAMQNADTNAQQLGINRYNAETQRGQNAYEGHAFGVGYSRKGYSKRHH